MAKIITSLQHPLVKHLVKLRDDKQYRFESGSAMLEGKEIIAEVSSCHKIKTLLICHSDAIPKGIAEEIVVVNAAILKKISGMHSFANDEWIAEIALPQNHSLKDMQWVIALDGISDPGNLGNILRTALALGWQGAYILKNCCDPFNDKAIKAAKGATFRLPISQGNWDGLKDVVRENNVHPLIADINGTELSKIGQRTGILLVLGNEAHGPSKQSLEMGEKVCIPMPGSMESLNVSVAGGILMYVLKNKP